MEKGREMTITTMMMMVVVVVAVDQHRLVKYVNQMSEDVDNETTVATNKIAKWQKRSVRL